MLHLPLAMFSTFALILLIAIAVCDAQSGMPFPWTAELKESDPLMEGSDVTITQNLLKRDSSVAEIEISGVYDSMTVSAVSAFQKAHSLPVDGAVGAKTAQELLDCCSADGVTDSGFTAASRGYKYKLLIPVHQNRSVETTGTLFDANNGVLLSFPVRAHGHRDDGVDYAWPDFGDGDAGLNQFTSNGATTTGVIEVDLNSPEPSPQLYGPWPVNRLIRGLEGNAQWLMPNIRDGMLLHTGNWTTADHGTFDPLTMDMPNSAGCLHAHPNSVERIYKALVSIGVTVNENPFSGKDYPFTPQGIMVVTLVTGDEQ